MFANFCRRRLAVLIGVCTAAVLAAAGVGTGAVAAQQQAPVPWASVGLGWELVTYTNGTATTHAATTLYLISPAGARYSLYTWRASANSLPVLVAWSGDRTRALVYESGGQQLAQLNLVTGKLSPIDLAGQASAIGYTLPDGLNILGVRVNGPVATLARYSLTGALLKVLATSDDYFIAGVYSADGTTLAVSGTTGVQLVSNASGVIRRLPVPGTDPLVGCTAVRWWSADTILAQCAAKPDDLARLWLVPASGAKPTALTPLRKPTGYDLGDLDAWLLTSGLYLQSVGACGTVEINKQAPNGSVTPVNVPGTLNANNRIVTASGSRLLIDALTGCYGSDSLLWFNPGTRAEQWLLKAHGNALGVLGVVPYNSQENAPAFSS